MIALNNHVFMCYYFFNSSLSAWLAYRAADLNRLLTLIHHKVMDFIPIDIDECSESSSNCTSDSTCVNTQGSYDCICPEGYSGDGRQDGSGCRGNKNYDRRFSMAL